MLQFIQDRKRLILVVAALVAIVALAPAALAGPTAQSTPSGDDWWPS